MFFLSTVNRQPSTVNPAFAKASAGQGRQLSAISSRKIIIRPKPRRNTKCYNSKGM